MKIEFKDDYSSTTIDEVITLSDNELNALYTVCGMLEVLKIHSCGTQSVYARYDNTYSSKVLGVLLPEEIETYKATLNALASATRIAIYHKKND